jgi:hypothetical protein
LSEGRGDESLPARNPCADQIRVTKARMKGGKISALARLHAASLAIKTKMPRRIAGQQVDRGRRPHTGIDHGQRARKQRRKMTVAADHIDQILCHRLMTAEIPAMRAPAIIVRCAHQHHHGQLLGFARRLEAQRHLRKGRSAFEGFHHVFDRLSAPRRFCDG